MPFGRRTTPLFAQIYHRYTRVPLSISILFPRVEHPLHLLYPHGSPLASPFPQVEHPVTEAVTGLDLVELMIRVAAGERLPSSLTSGPVPIIGHAFESRVYAEDPFRGFLPSTGRLSTYIEPSEFAHRDDYLSPRNAQIRADAGVTQGSEISMFYDPMICKLITHAPTRDAALDRMRAALDAYVIRGVGHNIPFLRALCDHPRFCEGRLSTGFIKEVRGSRSSSGGVGAVRVSQYFHHCALFHIPPPCDRITSLRILRHVFFRSLPAGIPLS